MRRLLITLVWLASTIAGPATLPAAASAVTCGAIPQSLTPLGDGKRYALVIGALAGTSDDFDVSLFSATSEYRAMFRDVHFESFGKPRFILPAVRPYRSVPQVVSLPAQDVLTLAVLNSRDPSQPTLCSAFVYTADYYEKRLDPKRRDSAANAIEANDIREIAGSARGIAASLVGPTPLKCDEPYVDSRIVRLVEPDYPASARNANAVGSVMVDVSTDENGEVMRASIRESSGNSALDRAALNAARHSSYAPAIVRCAPAKSDYYFRADFSGS